MTSSGSSDRLGRTRAAQDGARIEGREVKLSSTRSRLLRHTSSTREALAHNAAHQFAASHALLVFRTGAVYSFIPKNGCTTLRYSLALANGCIADAEDFSWVHKNNATFAANLREIACAPFSFVVLRDPLARLASVYLDKIVARRPQAWGLLDTMAEGTDPDTLTFRKFVEVLMQPYMLALDIHWRPQVDFLVYEHYDAVIRLEALSEAAPMLAERAGLELMDARALSGHGNDRYEAIAPGMYADLSPAEIRAMRAEGKTVALLDLYDAGLRRIVSRKYADDVALYEAMFGETPPSLR
ncbi:MAG: sulfotransferase family 2 domain-containing protein [Pseudomonadota bacterium]